MNLLPRLRAVADAWVERHRLTDPNVSLKTLGVRAADNSSLFERRGMKVETFERVALWLGDPFNWPAALVPEDQAQALHEIGVDVPAAHWVREAA